jgi:hypothetical protein
MHTHKHLHARRTVWHEVSHAREDALRDGADEQATAGADWLQMHLEIRWAVISCVQAVDHIDYK